MTEKERRDGYLDILHRNTLQSIISLIHAAEELGIELEMRALADKMLSFENKDPGEWKLTEELAGEILTLWKKDGGIKATYKR
jgi:hypothetical protein